MPDKISTIVLKVDLQCNHCYKKIKKTLCKLQDRGDIQSAVFDEKNNTVTVSGPFDPKKVIRKICCKACNIIKDIQIVEEKKPDPPPPAPPAPKPAPEPAPPATEPAPPVPEQAPEPAPPAQEPEPTKSDPEPQKVEPEPPKPEPVVKPPEPAYQYPMPAWAPGGPGSGCCCRPWFEAYSGGCRCCSCGWVYRPVGHGPPPPPPTTIFYGGPAPQEVYGGGSYCDGPRTCEFICEETPSTCRIM